MFRFPFTNFHELNLDWILSVVKEAKAVFDNGREDIDYAVQTADEAKEIAQQAAEATIPDNAVTTQKIRDYAVTSDKIATYAVTTDKIQEGGVTKSKLSNEIKNAIDYKIIDVLFPSYTGALVRFPATGTDGRITNLHTMLNCFLGTPEVQNGEITIITYDGYLTASGGVSGVTSLKVVLGVTGASI